jgi:hypothetical protein
MSVKCPRCDTPTEFADASTGVRMVFKLHDDGPRADISQFCLDGMTMRIRDLERALIGQREMFEHYGDRLRRHMDQILASHGLPTISDRAAEADARAKIAMAEAMRRNL